jgi:cyclic 2,3-diphosphoglycerate synthetase
VPVQWAPRGADVPAIADSLRRVLAEYTPDVVVDLSDEPVLDSRRRLQLASHTLLAGVAYEGPDFALRPPPRPRVATRPTIAVIGTGKRTGKTAVAGEIARQLLAAGRTPVLVAMGRGGPPEPVVVPAGSILDPEALLAVADAGGHAASDFYEDALTTGAATVGARRCGGGLAGAVGYANVADAVRAAEALPGDVTVLEGSGAAIPPVHADATALVVPGDADPELVAGYLGGYRVLLADLIVVTMAESPRASPDQVEAVLGAIGSISRSTPVLRTVLRPVPLGPVAQAKVFFATTAPSAVGAALATSLEERYGCEVVACSSRLADRPALRADLAAAPAFDVLLVELKAAAVDVAARTAARVGARIVFCDNRPVVVEANVDAEAATEASNRIAEAVGRLARLAGKRR